MPDQKQVTHAGDLRREILKTLPLSRGPLEVRGCELTDLDLLAAWPAYPYPYNCFEFSFAGHRLWRKEPQ